MSIEPGVRQRQGLHVFRDLIEKRGAQPRIHNLFRALKKPRARRGDGRAGRLAVTGGLERFGQRESDDGFAVVERTRWGWEAPRAVARADLDGYVDQVPACISAA